MKNELTSPLEREQKVLLYATEIIDGLVEKGFLTGDKLLTEMGHAQCEELRCENFHPTDEELRDAVIAIVSENARRNQ